MPQIFSLCSLDTKLTDKRLILFLSLHSFYVSVLVGEIGDRPRAIFVCPILLDFSLRSELIILQLWELGAAGSPWVPPRLENLIVLLTRSGYFIQQHHLASFGRFHIVFLAPGAGYTLF